MKQTLIAKLSDKPAENAKQPDTPMVSAWSFVVKHGTELRETICVRTYFNPRGTGMQPVRACVWLRPAVHGADWRSGKGSAGGCGYHKESQAIADAFTSAGVTLYGHAAPRADDKLDMKKVFYFGGTGESYYPAVFEATARALRYRLRPGSSILVRH